MAKRSQPDLKFSKKMQLQSDKPKRSKLVKELDRVFSLYVRYRDNWTCVKCGKIHAEGSKDLQNSHFFGRGNEGTRWDPDNCDSACGVVIRKRFLKGKGWQSMDPVLTGCHGEWERSKPGRYRDFKLEQLGESRFEIMRTRAEATAHFTRTDLMLLLDHWKEMLELEIKRFKEAKHDS